MLFILLLQDFGVFLPASGRLLAIVAGLDISFHLRIRADSVLYCCIKLFIFREDENTVIWNKFNNHTLAILSSPKWSMAYIWCNASMDLGNYKTFGQSKRQITDPQGCFVSYWVFQIIPVAEAERLRYKSM